MRRNGCAAPKVALTLLLLCAGACTRTDKPTTVAQVVAPDAKASAVAHGTHGAVSSAEARASEIGRDVLLRGGNAVDAAIAVAFALSVTHPSAANIGGGGFMIVRLPDGRATAIDYREVAPQKAHRDMFLDERGEVTLRSRRGPVAAGIPGVVAGLALAHEQFGTLPWRELLAPSIGLAREGHTLDEAHATELANGWKDVVRFAEAVETQLAQRPDAQTVALREALRATMATFGKDGGSRPYATGESWLQPELAKTLAYLAQEGPRAFYEGPLATNMAEGVRATGGIWTTEDLAGYRALSREPIRFAYHGHTITTMPPPSSGGVALRQILAGAEQLGLAKLGWDTPERAHLFAEILRRTFADRNQLLGDPAFVEMPLATLLSEEYAAARMASIDMVRATPSKDVRPGAAPAESRHTTHFSVVDRQGMAVSNTYTLNTNFGALVQIPGTGITLNNEMDDFTAKPGTPNAFGLVQGAQNAVAPGKRMLSSMSPTIVERDGKLRAVLGSPGGPTIITTVAQVLMQLVDHGRTLSQAVSAPRMHHQWLPDEVWLEPGVPAAVREGLRARGHHLEEAPVIGHANCIAVDPETGALDAVADVTRGGGGAAAF